ncbi:hypothetical protein TNCV_907351 [Trichonephila clavipes]|nr:hypothetical protein TNCV_907351 [Trichonephila clavipes]
MNTIVITAGTESGFVAKDDLVPFLGSPVSSCAAPFQTKASVGMVILATKSCGLKSLKYSHSNTALINPKDNPRESETMAKSAMTMKSPWP